MARRLWSLCHCVQVCRVCVCVALPTPAHRLSSSAASLCIGLLGSFPIVRLSHPTRCPATARIVGVVLPLSLVCFRFRVAALHARTWQLRSKLTVTCGLQTVHAWNSDSSPVPRWIWSLYSIPRNSSEWGDTGMYLM